MQFANRSYQVELIDGEEFSGEELAQCLRQLKVINILTGGYAPTLEALEQFARLKPQGPGRPIRILDIGFGYGDTLRVVSKWARLKDLSVELTGVDISPLATEAAREVTPPSMGIHYQTRDIFSFPVEEKYDVIINSLFMHHLSEKQVPDLLRWMSQHAEVGWFINDLHRHAVAYYFIKWLSRLAGLNRLIRHDAPLSVARSFRKEDWQRYIAEADLPEGSVQVQWHWAFRYGVLYFNREMMAASKEDK